MYLHLYYIPKGREGKQKTSTEAKKIMLNETVKKCKCYLVVERGLWTLPITISVTWKQRSPVSLAFLLTVNYS